VEYRVLASSVAPETIVPMRLGAIVVDLAVIGDMLGMARAALRSAAGARRRGLHRQLNRRPARAGTAARG